MINRFEFPDEELKGTWWYAQEAYIHDIAVKVRLCFERASDREYKNWKVEEMTYNIITKCLQEYYPWPNPKEGNRIILMIADPNGVGEWKKSLAYHPNALDLSDKIFKIKTEIIRDIDD